MKNKKGLYYIINEVLDRYKTGFNLSSKYLRDKLSDEISTVILDRINSDNILDFNDEHKKEYVDTLVEEYAGYMDNCMDMVKKSIE